MAKLILKITAACAGGVLGSLVMILLFFLVNSVISGVITSDEVSAIAVFLLMMIVFLASTVSNLLAVWFISFVDKKRYKKLSTVFYQIFIVSLVSLVLVTPVYLLSANSSYFLAVVALHVLVVTLVSGLILEVYSDVRHSLLQIYGLLVGVLLSAISFGVLASVVSATQLLLFIMIPVTWAASSLGFYITQGVYGWLIDVYDKDFLDLEMNYGRDYGKEEEVEGDEKEEEAETKDKLGSDFLKK